MIISIRPMQRVDLDIVSIIEATVVEFPWPLSQFSDSLTLGHQCSVLSVDNIVQGFSIFSHVLDEATLLNIAVNPALQGQGLGKALLQQGLQCQLLAGMAQCFLEVRCTNINAQQLYQSFGFIKVGERKNYYPACIGREGAWVMSLDMTNQSLAIV